MLADTYLSLIHPLRGTLLIESREDEKLNCFHILLGRILYFSHCLIVIIFMHNYVIKALVRRLCTFGEAVENPTLFFLLVIIIPKI